MANKYYSNVAPSKNSGAGGGSNKPQGSGSVPALNKTQRSRANGVSTTGYKGHPFAPKQEGGSFS